MQVSAGMPASHSVMSVPGVCSARALYLDLLQPLWPTGRDTPQSSRRSPEPPRSPEPVTPADVPFITPDIPTSDDIPFISSIAPDARSRASTSPPRRRRSTSPQPMIAPHRIAQPLRTAPPRRLSRSPVRTHSPVRSLSPGGLPGGAADPRVLRRSPPRSRSPGGSAFRPASDFARPTIEPWASRHSPPPGGFQMSPHGMGVPPRNFPPVGPAARPGPGAGRTWY